ncbi:MAG: GAF domain-containing protein, partial [Anaerolineae bacterium]|nr:GAF domain-containing protein [Anaerolineae bacterium]
VRAVLGAGTIRTRLLISFVGLVLIPLIVLGIAAVVGGLNNGRQQVINQLESVAILKQAALETWVDDLHADLTLVLVGDEVMRRALVLLEGPGDPATRTLAEGVVRTRFDQTISATGRYQELLLLNLDGRVVVSTDELHEGNARGSQVYFRQGLEGKVLQPPRYSPTTMSTSVFVARPVLNYQGSVLGVVVGRASLDRLNEIMLERAGLGQTGQTYLVGATHTLLTPSRMGRLHVAVFSEGIDASVDEQINGAGMYRDNERVAVVGSYRWLPELQVALIAEQEQAEAFQAVLMRLIILSGVALLAGSLAVGASLLITRTIATPLTALAQSARRIATGDLRQASEEKPLFQDRDDEVGVLARVFHSTTERLQSLIGGLEDRVAERTQELAQRSTYLEAAAEVSRVIASILDADLLIRQVVQVIHREFSLRYVGLFLLDDAVRTADAAADGNWAILRAAAGEEGEATLERGQRLRIEVTRVGAEPVLGDPRGAEDTLVGAELPEARSESKVVLSLRSRGQTIGALLVQYDEPGAFDQNTLVVLQTMADQVAVALDNARLFAERQQAVDIAQRAYGELSREAWIEILRVRPELGFLSDRHGVGPARTGLGAEAEMALQLGQTMPGAGGEGDGRHALAVPIRVRGQVVGVIDTYKPAEAGEWTAEEITLLERIAGELDPALESARLYQDTQRRAAREQAIRHVTDRMRRSVEIEAILESTIVGLARVLGAPRVYVRLAGGEEMEAVPSQGEDGAGGPGAGLGSVRGGNGSEVE